MFFTYLRRELRRRRKAALVVASGLALGIALVIVVSSVSSGMEKAQGKVLESLYGLGTDMTVTKAAAAAGENDGQRPRFEFDAQDDDSDENQSSDLVRVQGFQTLASSTVTEVGEQAGVAQAVGGLSLQVIKVDGQFRRGQFQQDEGTGGQPGGGSGAGGRNGGTGQPEGRVEGGGAQFDVDNYSVYGTDVTEPDLGPLTSSKITSGRTFKTSETDAEVVVADRSYAKEKELKVGDSVTVNSVKYTVIGIATPDSGDAAADLYMPLKQAQTLSDSKDKVTTIYVRASDSQRIDGVKAAIQKNIDGTTVTTSADLADTVSGSLSTASDLASDVGKWLSIAVLVAAFLVAGLLTSSAVSRRVREFGTLKALGWKSGRVTRQVVGEAVVNGLVGGALGIALGLGGAYVVTAISPTLQAEIGATAGGFGGPGAGAPGGGGFPGGGGPGGGRQTASNALDVALTAPVSVTTIGVAVGLAVAGGLIAGAFGGWRASRLRPADALRRVE
ncbi:MULTISPECIES: ABC transporter permease [Streptomyces]|uniref:ABC-type antimicrobial peptide transport system permease subunit n=1 Tax=Streptomyces stelliscabiei TaxID=146820 RepID=A0A8I0TU42_9ACTN|nr:MULTISPECIES: ABC transporter permease [Streptomyces]KND30460.1 membrane protein [Streptomyces stelliscabiei]MBE1599646.1 ABC-type antimicrobial peptide transport system permease subunit [Streptomyces stelliscabiei]MDX2519311.1 ABC transporter permease [Streptomyces stelliscabiei]MDX2549759.1 ABC transporter permease [Streptomyces stelliscabiei]MDX2616190.1 ABC transporter permease [Streptomyces stelliscabiei]